MRYVVAAGARLAARSASWALEVASARRALAEGRCAEAARALEPANRIDPDDPAVAALLGQALVGQGRRSAGAALLRSAGERLLEANAPIQRVLEVLQQMQQARDFDAAATLAERLVGRAPDDARAWHAQAVVLAQLNRPEPALAAARTAAALTPDSPALLTHQASLEATAGDLPGARARLEAVLRRDPDAATALRAHKELARILDLMGDPRHVFDHVDAAFGRACQLADYRRQDPALIPNLIAANRSGYSPASLARWRDAAFDTPAPAFLMGFYRSGTTLTQQVLGSHPAVYVADEEHFLSEVRDELRAIDGSADTECLRLARLDHAGVSRLRRRYWEAVRERLGAAAASARVFLDKTTMNTVDVGLIGTIFPDSKLVFLIRDPRDVCLSCVLQLMPPTPSTIHLMTWRGTLAHYARVMDWWEHVRDALDASVLEVRYEELVLDLEGVGRRLFRFLDLDWRQEALQFERAARGRHIASPSRAQVTRPLNRDAMGRWRAYPEQMREAERDLAPFLEMYGYAS